MRVVLTRALFLLGIAAIGIGNPLWGGVALAQKAGSGVDADRAYLYLKVAADGGQTDAQARLGEMLVKGDMITANVPQGMSYLEKAADGGNAGAALLLGDILVRGTYGVAADPAKGRALLEKAGEQRADAKAKLGEYLLRGTMMPADPKAGVTLLQAASDMGWTRATTVLADAYLSGSIAGIPADQARGIALLHKAADAKDADAMAKLGEYLLRGRYMDANETEGMAYLRSAAAAGSSRADFVMATFLLKGSDKMPADQKAALVLFDAAVASGNSDAMATYGDMLLRGRTVPLDAVRGVSLLKTSMDAGNSRAKFLLGSAYLRGIGVAVDATQGEKLLNEAVQDGSTEAMAALGEALVKGDPLPKDVARGVPLLEKAAASGNARANYLLGEAYLRGGFSLLQSPEKGRAYLQAASDAGYLLAQRKLGEELLSGNQLANDVEGAITRLTAAADGGDSRAAFRLGQIYLTGRDGIPQDAAKGEALLRSAMDEGDIDATAALGDRLFSSDAVDRRAEGLALLQRAADEGQARAAYLLGRAYMDGHAGVTVNTKAGIDLLQRAASSGFGWASIRLGNAALKGEGQSRNTAAAREHFKAALASGATYAVIPLANTYLKTGPGAAADPKRGLAILSEEAEKGNLDAIRQLLSFYGEGRWQVTEPNRALWSKNFALLERFGTPDDVAVETVLTELRRSSKPATYAKLATAMASLPASNQSGMIGRVLKVSPNAFVYVMQQRLNDSGRYRGPINGRLTGQTIRAINVACADAAGSANCEAPLSIATGAYIVSKF